MMLDFDVDLFITLFLILLALICDDMKLRDLLSCLEIDMLDLEFRELCLDRDRDLDFETLLEAEFLFTDLFFGYMFKADLDTDNFFDLRGGLILGVVFLYGLGLPIYILTGVVLAVCLKLGIGDIDLELPLLILSFLAYLLPEKLAVWLRYGAYILLPFLFKVFEVAGFTANDDFDDILMSDLDPIPPGFKPVLRDRFDIALLGPLFCEAMYGEVKRNM